MNDQYLEQDVYYCLIEAGYDPKIADILCGNQKIKETLKSYKENAIEKARAEFIELYRSIKNPVTELFTQRDPERR